MSFTLVSLALATSAIHWIDPSFVSAIPPRRILRPKDNVGEMIKRNRNRGRGDGQDSLDVDKDRYTIHTEIEAGFENAGTQIAMDVVEAINPAVTPETIVQDERGNEFTVGEEVLLYTLLVTDVDTADGADTFAMLAINPDTDDMHGVVQKRGKRGEHRPYKIKQSRGENQGIAMAEEEINLQPPEWHCDVAEEIPGDEESVERRLIHDLHGVGDHPDHPHNHDHHHHDQHPGQDENISVMETLTRSVRGIKANPLNKSRRLQTASYNYQVDMFIEIDNKLVSNLGGLNNAVNYVNTMVTGANVVYEKEIDTHLRVTKIVVSSLYDSATSTSEALSIMRAKYAGSTWHTPNVDIHHALLGGSGGGIAYIGVLCSSDWAYGLTGGLSGSFMSMGEPVMWDMKGFMHEIGHNFGSGHSHDIKYYDPVIDVCGISCPTTTGFGWSTIMSYCQWCPGSYGNVMYSFGADYDGSGDVYDLANWPANPKMVANYDSSHFSVNPSREAQKMHLHVLSKAPSGCVALSSPAPLLTPEPTQSPTSSFGVAFYDATLGAPKCSKVTNFCDSGTLLNSRGTIGGKLEPNGPNTLDACTDGATGTYHTDESIDNIRISSVGGGNIQPGATVQIVAKVWSYNPSNDFVDFFYASDATNPQWKFIATVQPTSSSASTVSTQYTLGNGSVQAVRVVIRYNGAASPCPGGAYDDVDDLAFVVNTSFTPQPTPKPTPFPTSKPTPAPILTPSPTLKPTPAPVSTASPTVKPTLVSITADPTASNVVGNSGFDFDLGVPICSTADSFCDSGSLLNSRDSIAGMSEPNGPNTLDYCTDGTLGTYHSDESVDNIKVSSVGGGNIEPGSTVQVAASIWAYNPSADYVDFYYAYDATNPQWQFLETVKPTTPGASTVSVQFVMGEGDLQAVRVVLRVHGLASPCPEGSYDDVDDLVFFAKPSNTAPSRTQQTPRPTRRPTLLTKTSKRVNQLLSN